MRTSNIHLGARRDTNTGSDSDQSLLIVGGALTFVTAVTLFHPHPLALPLLSVVLVLAGFALAGCAWAWRFFHKGEDVPARPDHLSGLIVFFGFAAAILGDPNAAVQSLQMHI